MVLGLLRMGARQAKNAALALLWSIIATPDVYAFLKSPPKKIQKHQ